MTQQVGRVEWVATVQARSFASAAAAISDTTITVQDGTVFAVDPLPGSVELPDGSVVTYDSWDQTTIELTDPLVVAIDEGDPIEVFPVRFIRFAGVNFAPDDEWSETVPCRIPHGSQWFTRLEDQIYEDDDRPVVTVDLTTQPFLVDIENEPALIDGSYIDPESTIPPAALTDGIPPASSPTPVLEPFAVGALRWSVTPVANADPVRFRVYADTFDPPTVDAAHLVADTASWSGTFAAINGVALLPADPAVEPDPIFVACVEYDADGDASLSATSASATPRRAGVSEISADYVYAGAVEANQIQAGVIEAELSFIQLLLIGPYGEWDGETGDLTIYADLAHTEPLVQLRQSGSVFRGRVEADDVSVLTVLIMQGTASHIAQNGGLTLDASIQDPNSVPTLTMTPDTQVWPAITAGYTQAGMAWDATLDGGAGGWLRLIKKFPYVTGTSKVQRIYGSPLAVQSEVTLSGGSEDNVHSIVRLGSNYFTMGPNYPEGGTGFYVYKWTTAGAVVAKTVDIYDPTDGYPCVGSDGTNLLVATPFSTNISIEVVSPSTLVGGTFYTNASAIVGNLGYVARDNFDFGADRIIVGTTAGNVHAFTESGGTLTEQTAEAFTGRGWLGWDGSNFFGSTTGILDKYSDYYPSASENAYVSYRDTDGGAGHTKDSPHASIALTKRRYVQAVLPPAPSGATTPTVWADFGTSDPADTALLLRPETITNRVILIDPATAGGTDLDPDSNTFGSGVAAWIKSALGGLELYGDGSLTIGGEALATEGWTSFTPTWTSTGTQPSLGNGTLTGRYQRIGNTFHFRIELVAGSTTTYGTGTWTFSLPFTPTSQGNRVPFPGLAFDVSAGALYSVFGQWVSGASILAFSQVGATGQIGGLGPTAPFTWANTDRLTICGTCELA